MKVFFFNRKRIISPTESKFLTIASRWAITISDSVTFWPRKGMEIGLEGRGKGSGDWRGNDEGKFEKEKRRGREGRGMKRERRKEFGEM